MLQLKDQIKSVQPCEVQIDQTAGLSVGARHEPEKNQAARNEGERKPDREKDKNETENTNIRSSGAQDGKTNIKETAKTGTAFRDIPAVSTEDTRKETTTSGILHDLILGESGGLGPVHRVPGSRDHVHVLDECDAQGAAAVLIAGEFGCEMG